jgi:diguanylate cyclase (GGDEF)-like protein
MDLYHSPTVKLEQIFDTLNYCIAICTSDMSVVGINKTYANLYGAEPKDLIGKRATDISPSFTQSVFYECCLETIKTGETISRVGYSNPLKGWYAIRTAKYSDEYFVLIAHEISKDQNYSGFVPIHDVLTNLYNKHKFEDDIRFHILKKEQFGLIIIDILKLKKINQLYGTFNADMVLMEIAGKLKLNLYKNGVTEVYKISPDQFAVISLLDKDKCVDVIQKITDIFKEVFKISNDVINLDIVMGFNYLKDFKNNKDTSEFIIETENAVQIAKDKKTLYFEHNKEVNLVNKKELLYEIKEAFKNKEFILYYQPQIDCIKNKICGAEALIRWNHKNRGILSPFHFIDLIEEFELNEELDKYVMEQVMHDSNYFKSHGFELPLSLNLSTNSLYDNKILDFYDEQAKKLLIDSSLLTIEITESSLIESIELSKKVISSFSDKGLKIAIDDFGAGYSSFGYLVRYPTNYLKIDREFITNIHQHKNLKQVVLNLIKMAHSLNMIVVAEGVEIEEEAQILKKYNCDIIQGYFYGKPMPKEQLLSRIQLEGISNFKSDFY